MSEGTGNGINRRQALLAAAAGAVATGVVGGFGSASAQTPEAPAATELTDEVVMTALHGALAKATELGVPSVVAIFDRNGTQRGFFRQDGALVISTTLAPQKSYTAAVLGAPTADFGASMSSDPISAAALLKLDNITLLGGGLPIVLGGVPVGGIGSSGGSVDQDIEVATAGLQAIGAA
jgi:uncharacterized protein GlcG (DUF336 family)